MSTRVAPPGPGRTGRLSWATLVLTLAWAAAVRVPLVLNAADHLDSDLAVDGLTLLEATRGHGRWHYPGTPFTGIGPVLLSLPQALVWGATPGTLVSGGTVAYLVLLVATFLLVRRGWGPGMAAWSLAPLTFASNGAVWLSARITGGHLLAAAWHAGAFALLAANLDRGGRARAAALGAWCGAGLYLDSMFAVTLVGLIPAAVGFWAVSGFPWRGLTAAAVFGLGFLAGFWPKPVGGRLDPYDAYRDQLSFVSQPAVLAEHARLLAGDCLPRLLAGHRLPGLETEPDPLAFVGLRPAGSRLPFDGLAVATVALAGVVTAASLVGLALALRSPPAGPGRAVAWGLTLSAAATLVGFVANRNIFNSDNYRYLVGLYVPWSLGFGLAAHRLAKAGQRGRAVALSVVALLALVMTADLGRWYSRFGWVDSRGCPVRKVLHDPTLAWLESHPAVTWVYGGYWDVYRLAFLTGGRVRGVPFPVYPNRFPEWAPGGDARRQATVARATPEGSFFLAAALRQGQRVVSKAGGVTILAWP